MPVSKDNVHKLDKTYTFNMVNSDNEYLKKLGLEPLYLTSIPAYINLNGNIFYSGSCHYECNLANDIVNILKIMNSNKYDRFEHIFGFLNDNYSINFSIYNNQIFFDDMTSLSVYKNNKGIRDEINKKYGLSDEFYIPTRKEIYQNYGYEYFLKNKDKYGYDIIHGQLNMTPQEYFDIMISSKKNELAPYSNANNLDAHDLRQWLNCNANIFMDHFYSWETTGVYNEETMNYINSILQTKLNIYEFFYKISKQAKNWQQLVKKLLIAFNVFNEFKPIERDPLNPFCGDSDYAERNYWDTMFYEASFDMLIQLIGFDKIETQVKKTITTSKPNIYEEFFNPMIMDYEIVQLPKLVFDEDTQKFRWIYPNEFINTGINREFEEEIKLIKKYVPYNERHKYLR